MAHEIGSNIVVGKLAEGSLLPRESELAETFGVSRQAVREALKVLAAKGLVASRRRTGTQVQPRRAWNLLDPDVIAWHPVEKLPAQLFADLVELRRYVEPAAAELAAERGNRNAVAVIMDAVERMKVTLDDEPALNAADIQFHMGVFDASGNVLFQRLGLVIRPLLEASFLLQTGARANWSAMVPAHATVAAAIASGDGKAARREMERIVAQASFELGYSPIAVY